MISWSLSNYSHLPWRKNRNLYTTLVSEIMLQQTTVGTVLNHFERFIQKYPNIKNLAKINEEQILKEWKGLGYYRRARNLLNAAKEICQNFEGEIPLDFDKLKSIKGIGDYTANAILAIGADQSALALDANLERVISRMYGLTTSKGLPLQKDIQRLFDKSEICQDIESYGGRTYNEALMDLGRSLCKARSSACEICPLAADCLARASGEPLSFPRVNEKANLQKSSGVELSLLRVILKKGSRILAYKKAENEWLSNQYEIPTFTLSSQDNEFKQYPMVEANSLLLLSSFRTGITKYKIDNFVIYMSEAEFEKELASLKDFEWIDDESLLSTASLKALKFFK